MDNIKIPELSQGRNNTPGEIYINNDGNLPVEGQNQLEVFQENLYPEFVLKQWILDLVENSKVNLLDKKYLASLGESILTEDGLITLDKTTSSEGELSQKIEAINLQSIIYAINSIDLGYDYLSKYYDVVSNDTIAYRDDGVDSGVIYYRYRTPGDVIYTGKVSFCLATNFDKIKIKVTPSIYLYLTHWTGNSKSDNYLKILTPQGGDVDIIRVDLHKDHGWEDRGNVLLTEQYQMTICDEEMEPIIFE